MKSSNTFQDSEDGTASVQREEFHPTRPALAGAVLAVTAAYFYFLSFAQFGLLRMLQTGASGGSPWRGVVTGVLLLAGIGGSGLAAWWYTEQRCRPMLLGGFFLCGAVAGISLVAEGPGAFGLVALLTGLGIGWVTVTLAATLRRVTGGERLGSCLGAGIGLAYALANLPVVQRAGPSGLAIFALIATCGGLLAVQAFEWRAPAHKPAGSDYQPYGMAAWVLVFLALVGLDSATYFILQHDPVEWAVAWGSSGRQYINALVHAMAALLAGYALDRRWMGRTVLIGAVLLLAACHLAGITGDATGRGALLYIGGVSLSFTTLVFYPARCGRPWVAALVYAVDWWAGSALGLLLAQHHRRVPDGLLVSAGLLMGGAMLARRLLRRQERRGARV